MKNENTFTALCSSHENQNKTTMKYAVLKTNYCKLLINYNLITTSHGSLYSGAFRNTKVLKKNFSVVHLSRQGFLNAADN